VGGGDELLLRAIACPLEHFDAIGFAARRDQLAPTEISKIRIQENHLNSTRDVLRIRLMCATLKGISHREVLNANSHRQVLQFFPNQAQFANDLLGDLVFQDFTSLSRNAISFTAGSSIVLVAPRGPVFHSSG
jgi:hypothetical protein